MNRRYELFLYPFFDHTGISRHLERMALKGWELEKTGGLLYHEMNRGMWFLNFTGSIAPSLGLLGTVTGLISAFGKMAEAGGNVNIQDLSAGIWEAMLTTAFGMTISIPALLCYRAYRRIIEKRMMALSMYDSPVGQEAHDA